MKRHLVLLACALVLSGCMPAYTLVQPKLVSVAKGTMQVKPSVAWNKAPRNAFDVPGQETWTQNGELLDSITFIGAVKDGDAIGKQRPKDDRKVPVFRSSMTPQDLVSMVESFYRIKAGATIFETTGVTPSKFLGHPAIEFNFSYVGTDELKRRGRSLLAIIDGKLYFMSLEGASLHYFDAALPEFQAIAQSATRT